MPHPAIGSWSTGSSTTPLILSDFTKVSSTTNVYLRENATIIEPKPVIDEAALAELIVERTFTADQRKQMAKDGTAMSDGGFPIASKDDLRNAIQAFGRAKDKDAAKAHIIKRARALGATDMLPDGWSESNLPTDEDSELREVVLDEAPRSLPERSIRRDGTVKIQLITPGMGSSGFYPAEVLRRDGPGIFVAGTHMYLDHPALSEDVERPERSVKDLAAVLTEDASWSETGPGGPGLYALAKVFTPYRPLLEELGPYIGVSIRARGEAREGQLPDGSHGPIVEKLVRAESVDFVTKAGRGGRILSLLESARRMTSALTPSSIEANEANRNVGQWLEATLHLGFTQLADEMFADGRLTREERIALSAAIGSGLEAFTTSVQGSAPQLFERDPFKQSPQPDDEPESEDETEQTTPRASAEEKDKEQEADLTANATQTSELAESAQALQTEIVSLKESNTTLIGERDQARRDLAVARDALARELSARQLRETTDAVRSVLVEIDIPEPLPANSLRQRLEPRLVAEAPRGEDGVLDKDALIERVRKAVEDEVAYLTEAAGLGRVRGVGGGTPAASTPAAADKAVADLYRSFGVKAPASS